MTCDLDFQNSFLRSARRWAGFKFDTTTGKPHILLPQMHTTLLSL
ncbi:hypothetical protein AZE42_05017 [Rhizopogon vesiculosus]|uniref:Uncharacterized protein n=1 Tax=Rhizopogon vesiculosus TaxID=180088 RepID=A0A1J8QIR5_9AGAM|nr:hypothetical protein AZE42_05017 [Rhizopogon vesiculosus]